MEKRIHWQQIDSVVVLGLGQSGSSVVRFFAGENSPLNAECDIRIFDSREHPPGLDDIVDLVGTEQLQHGHPRSGDQTSRST